MKKLLTLLAVTTSLFAACDRVNSRQPASPSPDASPSTPKVEGFRLSGVVFEETSSGPRPVPGGGVFFWLESTYGGQAAIDASGRFTISGLRAGRFVRLT
jgi:hypothetical protein